MFTRNILYSAKFCGSNFSANSCFYECHWNKFVPFFTHSCTTGILWFWSVKNNSQTLLNSQSSLNLRPSKYERYTIYIYIIISSECPSHILLLVKLVKSTSPWKGHTKLSPQTYVLYISVPQRKLFQYQLKYICVENAPWNLKITSVSSTI